MCRVRIRQEENGQKNSGKWRWHVHVNDAKNFRGVTYEESGIA